MTTKEDAKNEAVLKRLMSLKFNEVIQIDPYTKVLRVPTGWIYKFYATNLDMVGSDIDPDSFMQDTCFVPFPQGQ